MLVAINVKCCRYKNSFRPVLSCWNNAHEIIMIDISDENNIIHQSKKNRSLDNMIKMI